MKLSGKVPSGDFCDRRYGTQCGKARGAFTWRDPQGRPGNECQRIQVAPSQTCMQRRRDAVLQKKPCESEDTSKSAVAPDTKDHLVERAVS